MHTSNLVPTNTKSKSSIRLSCALSATHPNAACENAKFTPARGMGRGGHSILPNPYDQNLEANSKVLSAAAILQVSPIPCSDILTIKLLKKGIKDVFLVDMTGKMLFGFDLVTGDRFAELIYTHFRQESIVFCKGLYEGRWYTVKVLKTCEENLPEGRSPQ